MPDLQSVASNKKFMEFLLILLVLLFFFKYSFKAWLHKEYNDITVYYRINNLSLLSICSCEKMLSCFALQLHTDSRILYVPYILYI